MTRFKVRRPAEVEPFVWERLGRGVRLVLMAAYAKTPEARQAAQAEQVRHSARELERALRLLEGGSAAPGGEQ